MLEFFFNELSNLSKQTAILESLDWSDDKLQKVMEVCAKSIGEMESNIQDYSSPNSFRDKITKDLGDLLSEDQVNSVQNQKMVYRLLCRTLRMQVFCLLF